MTQDGILYNIPYLWKGKSQLSGGAIKAALKNLLTTVPLAFQMRRYKMSTIHVLRSIFPSCKSPGFFISFPV